MDEREIDLAIDTAASEMMAGEPSRALSYKVMARVREGAARAPRRIVWVTAAASVVLCAAIAVALNRPIAPVISSLPAAPTALVGRAPMVIAPPTAVAQITEPLRRTVRGPIPKGVESPVRLPPSDVSPIEPMETEPIALSALDVPQLERAATSIEALDIEPLTIEPLAASND
jgi:hypothetical protein